MEKKYKLTEESIYHLGKTLYRIEALESFSNVMKGDKGGYVESEKNLSQEGNCWIYNDARVFDKAMIYDDAKVYGYARVYGRAFVCGNAEVFDNAKVCDNAIVYGNAIVCDNAKVSGNAVICNNAKVSDNALVYGYAKVCSDAEIKNNSDYIVFKNWWSSGRYFTWTKSNNMWAVGCFHGTGKELIAKAYEDSELSGREYKRVVDYVKSILKDNR